jgi:hypothetical protein
MTLREQWNRMITMLLTNRILGVRVEEDANPWKHPWQLTPRYNATLGRWQASMEPGFINGRDPSIKVAVESAPQATLDRYQRNNPKSKTENPKSEIDSWLTEYPLLDLINFRSLGPDSTASAASLNKDGSVTFSYPAVPPFFLALGVGSPPQTEADIGSGIVTAQADPTARLLRATDVVLTQPRVANQVAFQITQGDAAADTIYQYDVTSTNSQAIKERAKIHTTSQYTIPTPNDPLQQLLGVWADDGQTSLQLATVWFVSPPGAAYGSSPDATWTPYLQHMEFWNLDAQTNFIQRAAIDTQLSLNTGLAGGVGDRINQFLLAQVNDSNSAAAQFLARNTVELKFWSI